MPLEQSRQEIDPLQLKGEANLITRNPFFFLKNKSITPTTLPLQLQESGGEEGEQRDGNCRSGSSIWTSGFFHQWRGCVYIYI